MISIPIIMPKEMQESIASRMRDRRLALNLSQKTLSARSGVSYASIKKFEQTAQISLESLLKLAVVLGCLEDFNALALPQTYEKILSLDALMATTVPRKRGRQ